MIFNKHVAGGGARVLALILSALYILGLGAAAPHEANAVTKPGNCESSGTTSISFQRAGRQWSASAEVVLKGPQLSFSGPDGISSYTPPLSGFSSGGFRSCSNENGLVFYSGYGAGDRWIFTKDGRLIHFASPVMGPTKDGSITQYYTTGTDLLGHTIYTGTESANGMMKGGRYIWRPFGDKTPSLIGSASPADEKKGAYEMVILSPRERLYNMDANGGSWVGDVTQMRQIVDTNYKPVTEDRPTRAGYTLKGWNTKPDGTGDDVSIKGSTLKDGQTVYAQWEKDAGNPIRATIKCATRSDNNVLCSIIAYYADAPERTRELTVSGSNTLAWSGDGGITGIRLDASGYAGDVSCVDHRGSANAQCYYVSVADKPTQNTYQAQMPTTGAPEGLTTVGIMALTVSLIGLTVVLTRRRS